MLFHVGLPPHSAVSDSGNRGIVVALGFIVVASGFKLHSTEYSVILPEAQIETYLFLPAEKHYRLASVFQENVSFCFVLKPNADPFRNTATQCPARREPFFSMLLISHFFLRAPTPFHNRSFVSVPGGLDRSNSVLLTSVDSIIVSCRTSFAAQALITHITSHPLLLPMITWPWLAVQELI